MKHVSVRAICVVLLILVILPLQPCGDSNSLQAQDAAMSHTDNRGVDAAKIKVAVLLYDGALVLDYGIAAEMFLAADFMRKFSVYTIGRKANVTLSVTGATTTDFTLENAPSPDILIVPGGPMWSQEASEPATLDYLRQAHADSCIVYSICTGAMLLGKAGLLDGLTVTTNHQAAKVLQDLAPKANVVTDRSYIDNGTVVTAAGAGTAIEATLHLIERLCGGAVAHDLGSRYLDYPHLADK